MPKALTIQRSTVPSAERANYTKRLKALRSHYAAANCRFWVFEESSLPGAFIEFTDQDVVRHNLVQLIIRAYDEHTRKITI